MRHQWTKAGAFLVSASLFAVSALAGGEKYDGSGSARVSFEIQTGLSDSEQPAAPLCSVLPQVAIAREEASGLAKW